MSDFQTHVDISTKCHLQLCFKNEATATKTLVARINAWRKVNVLKVAFIWLNIMK